MSQAGDYGERRSEPWTYSRDTLPIKVYSVRAMNRSGKNGTLRVRYRRPKNYFKIEDAQRILAKVLPPPDQDGETWARKVIMVLREATIAMLSRILPFLPEGRVQALYDFCIDLLDKFFGVMPAAQPSSVIAAKSLIIFIADRVGISVTFPKQ